METPGGEAVIVLFPEFDFAACLDRAEAADAASVRALEAVGGPAKVQPEAVEWNIGEQRRNGLLVDGDTLGKAVVSDLKLQHALVLDPRTVRDCGPGGIEA